MATLAFPEPRDTSPQATAAAALEWLDAEHEVYAANKAAWEREERRYYGGDPVVDAELVQFDGETVATFEARKTWADYTNFVLAHVRAITGELSRHRPEIGAGISLGGMGDVRPRGEIVGRPTKGELFKYNIDGVGQDGSEFEPFMDGVDELAQVTGHRWLMVESPQGAGSTLPLRDVLAGQRPFAVHFSPLDVPLWSIVRGQLQFAVIRVETDEPRIVDGKFVDGSDKGYYLLVRKGCTALGEEFQGGGWWLYDSEKRLQSSAVWRWPEGDIPLWIHYGQRSRGTAEKPAISKSGTMELGQIAVALMNITSARDANFWDGCNPLTIFLNAGPAEMKALADQIEARGIYAGLPGQLDAAGNPVPITVHESAASVVPATVSEQVIASKFAAAREQSFQQLTSTPESSGESKKAGHAENKAPVLALRARERQQSENTLIHFFEKRFGIASPSGSSQWPTDFDLDPLVEAVDKTIARLQLLAVRSPTLEAGLIQQAAEDDGLWPGEPADQNTATEELLASAKAGSAKVKGDAMAALVNAGADFLFAAKQAGFSDKEVTELNAGGGNNQPDDEERTGELNQNGKGIMRSPDMEDSAVTAADEKR